MSGGFQAPGSDTSAIGRGHMLCLGTGEDGDRCHKEEQNRPAPGE